MSGPDDPFAGVDPAVMGPDIVALGGRLDAASVLAAYRRGIFPWPSDLPIRLTQPLRRMVRAGLLALLPAPDPTDLVSWWSPDPRPVVRVDRLHVPRTVRQQLRRSGWETTVDRAFGAVLAACADRTEGTWIVPDLARAYADLHALGHAHSLEVWQGDALVGGLLLVQVGGVVSGDSMFHRVGGASKVGVVDLVARLAAAGGTLVDTQQTTSTLQLLGQEVLPRRDYLAALAAVRDRPVVLDADRLPVARLA